MTVVRSDTFTRANQTGWGTASDGNVWTIQSGNGQSIASNEGLISGSTASTFATLGASLPGGDAEGLVRWNINNGSSTSGIILRWTNSNNYYLARYDGAGHIGFFKRVAGTSTTVGSYALTPTSGTYYWMRFRVQASNIFIRTWADGSTEPTTWNYTTTDTGLAGTGGAANYVGLYGYGYSPGNNYDHLAVDDLTFNLIQAPTASGTATTATVTTNATIAGNLLLYIISAAKNPGNVTFTMPAGWTQVGTTADQNTYISLSSAVYVYPNNPGGITSVAATLSGAVSEWDATLMEFSGLATTSPVDVSAEAQNAVSTALTGSVSATTTVAGDMLVGALIVDQTTNPGQVVTQPSGWTLAESILDAAGWTGIVSGYQVQSTAGAVSYAPTWSKGMDYILWLLALKPAGASGGSTVYGQGVSVGAGADTASTPTLTAGGAVSVGAGSDSGSPTLTAGGAVSVGAGVDTAATPTLTAGGAVSTGAGSDSGSPTLTAGGGLSVGAGGGSGSSVLWAEGVSVGAGAGAAATPTLTGGGAVSAGAGAGAAQTILTAGGGVSVGAGADVAVIAIGGISVGAGSGSASPTLWAEGASVGAGAGSGSAILLAGGVSAGVGAGSGSPALWAGGAVSVGAGAGGGLLSAFLGMALQGPPLTGASRLDPALAATTQDAAAPTGASPQEARLTSATGVAPSIGAATDALYSSIGGTSYQ